MSSTETPKIPVAKRSIEASRPSSSADLKAPKSPRMPKPEPKATDQDFAWTRDYQPWPLLAHAFSFMIPVGCCLGFVYFQICTWNSDKNLVLMHCRSQSIGLWSYPCEASKAFARGFPLLAASISLIVTGRFILQRRLYYHLLLKGALMDFTNFRPLSDALVFVLVFSFCCGMCHFVMDFCFPPFSWYIIYNKLLQIGVVYIVPCLMFSLVFGSLYNVERHLVSLANIYEEDSKWAKAHLAKSNMFTDMCIKEASRNAQRSLRQSVGVGPYAYDLDDCLGEIVSHCETSSGNRFGANTPRDSLYHFSGFVGIYQGLWPARILLDPALKDEGSRTFKRTWFTFGVIFVLTQFAILTIFGIRAFREAKETRPEHMPEGVLRIGGTGFEWMGPGYCRDDSMQRPDGYYKPLYMMVASPNDIAEAPVWRYSKHMAAQLAPDRHENDNGHSPAFTACAEHCADTKKCIGYAVDADLCNVYIGAKASAPAGWYDLAEKDPRVSSVRRHPVILQTTGSHEAECWKKFVRKGDSQDIVGAVVFALHGFFILWITLQAIRLTIWNAQNSSYEPLADPF